jgi:hypothetical protein
MSKRPQKQNPELMEISRQLVLAEARAKMAEAQARIAEANARGREAHLRLRKAERDIAELQSVKS